MKDCSPVGSRTFGWGMFPNDAKAACSALCLVASPIKLCLLSPQKGIKKRIVYEVAGWQEGLLACRLADLWLGHVPQGCKSRLQRSMPCCVLDQAVLAQSAKEHKKANCVRGGWMV